MAFNVSNASMRGPAYLPVGTRSIKVVILGAFGVGKTTYIETVSEISPLRTEESLTGPGQTLDILNVPDKMTTTVAMDFGRRTLDDNIVLYLFGAPGQPRFADTIRPLLQGALGGLVLLDARNVHTLEQSFESIGLLEEADIPYTIAVNQFDSDPSYDERVLREALTLPADTPLVYLDARRLESAKKALIALVTDILLPMRSLAG